MTESGPSSPGHLLPRACENCRLRKIRCDKQLPCGSCRTLGIACQAPTKVSEYRPRVVISNHYEKQIQVIQERLSNIELSIQQRLSAIELSIHGISLQNRNSTGPGSRPDNGVQAETPSATVPTAEGDSPFVRQTLQATETAETTASTLRYTPSEDVVAPLASLKSTLDTHYSPRSYDPYLSRCQPTQSTSDKDLPPISFVVDVVKKIKVHPPFTLVGFSWNDMSRIERLCQSVYLPFQPASPGSTALMHGLIYFILRDLMHDNDPIVGQHDCVSYLNFCEQRFSNSLSTYEVLSIPTLENIQILLLGAIKALEEGNRPLCWTYLSSASTLCQALGFHRKSTLQRDRPEEAQVKLHVFWILYMLEKNLCLSFGRSSNFRDYDIDCKPFSASSDPRLSPWDLTNLVCIEFGTLQSRIYDRLYSATAIEEPPDMRSQAVEQLVTELEAVREKFKCIDPSKANFSERLQVILACQDFVFYSLLTSCYLSQSGSRDHTEISTRCLQAARLSLQEHNQCFERFGESEFYKGCEYINWVLLFTSFSPYVVVFIHTVATNDQGDLALLRRTVQSLEAIKNINGGSHRLYSVCNAFLDAAVALDKAHRVVSGLQERDDGSLTIPPPGTASDLAWSDEFFNFSVADDEMTDFIENLLSETRPLTEMLHHDMDGANQHNL